MRKNPKGREIGFGRGIRLTEAGRKHPMYVGKPEVFNAPTVHLDEVETLPPGTTVLATNAVSDVQSAEIRVNGAVAWGVQYHPEYPLREIAAIVRRIGTAADRRRLLRSTPATSTTFAQRPRHARPRSRLQAAVLALRHQPERARQEVAHQRSRQLDRVPGAADAGEARAGADADFSATARSWSPAAPARWARAVVGALLEAGAACLVPYMHEAEAQRFPHRDTKVKLIAVDDLADEAMVAKVYDGVPPLGLDPHRRRLCHGQGRRHRQSRR